MGRSASVVPSIPCRRRTGSSGEPAWPVPFFVCVFPFMGCEQLTAIAEIRKMTNRTDALGVPRIDTRIYLIRGERVMLDVDLSELYGVATKRLNEQVKRNASRFPEDFMFRLTPAEVELLNRSQIATGSQKHRDPRHPPYAFTEHGAIQAANVLNSSRAAEMSVHVVRAFVGMREVITQNREIAKKLAQLEQRLDGQDETIAEIVRAIRLLMAPPLADIKPRRKIGFV